jgi:hypothetical protein
MTHEDRDLEGMIHPAPQGDMLEVCEALCPDQTVPADATEGMACEVPRTE